MANLQQPDPTHYTDELVCQKANMLILRNVFKSYIQNDHALNKAYQTDDFYTLIGISRSSVDSLTTTKDCSMSLNKGVLKKLKNFCDSSYIDYRVFTGEKLLLLHSNCLLNFINGLTELCLLAGLDPKQYRGDIILTQAEDTKNILWKIKSSFKDGQLEQYMEELSQKKAKDNNSVKKNLAILTQNDLDENMELCYWRQIFIYERAEEMWDKEKNILLHEVRQQAKDVRFYDIDLYRFYIYLQKSLSAE